MEKEFSQKRLFERGQKGAFGLYSGLQKLNEKVAQKGDNSDLISFMAPHTSHGLANRGKGQKMRHMGHYKSTL